MHRATDRFGNPDPFAFVKRPKPRHPRVSFFGFSDAGARCLICGLDFGRASVVRMAEHSATHEGAA